VPPLVAGLVVVVDPVEVVAVPPPEVDAAVLGAGLEALEPLSLELPPQPATAAAIAIAPATAQALIVRSIISFLWLPRTGSRRPYPGYEWSRRPVRSCGR
jgi:hypothetical protein